MANKTISNIRTDNAAAAPDGTEPIESVQSATSTAFTFAELENSPLNAQTGTAYTLVITDQKKTVTMNNAAANTLTIPLNASVAFHIGAKMLIRQIGAGATTVVGDGGVTVELDTNASLDMDGAQQQILLHKTATDTWHAAPVATGSGGGSGGAGAAARGAKVRRDTDQAVSTFYTVIWQTEVYDDAGFADLVANDDRLTVPAGVTRVNVYAYVRTTSSMTLGSQVQIKIKHFNSGDTEQEVPGINSDLNGSTLWEGNAVALGVDVVAGDYFEVEFFSSDTTVTLDFVKASIQDVTVGTQSTVTFKGALIRKVTTTARTASSFTVAFDQEAYDTDGFGDLGTDDDRLTIPAGVTKVQLHAILDVTGITVGSDNWMTISHFDSGDSFLRGHGMTMQNGITSAFGDVMTPILEVVEGDYFILQAASSDSSWDQEYVAMSLEYKDGSLIDAPQQIVDLSTFIQDKPTDAEKLMTFVVTTAFTLPSGLATSAAYAEVTGASAATIDIIKNGAAASGTINFASGTNAATFTLASDLVFAVGDRLQLVNQGTADTTLADISITLRGNL